MVGIIEKSGTYYIPQSDTPAFYSKRLKRCEPMKAVLRKLAIAEKKQKRSLETIPEEEEPVDVEENIPKLKKSKAFRDELPEELKEAERTFKQELPPKAKRARKARASRV